MNYLYSCVTPCLGIHAVHPEEVCPEEEIKKAAAKEVQTRRVSGPLQWV